MVVQAIKVMNLDVICKMSTSVPIQCRQEFELDLIEDIECSLEINIHSGVAKLFYRYELSGEKLEEDVDVEWYVVDWKKIATQLYNGINQHSYKSTATEDLIEAVEKYEQTIKIMETMTTEREDGYYWVTWNGARRIIEYSGGKWWITSNRWADEECLEDINENRIIEDGTE